MRAQVHTERQTHTHARAHRHTHTPDALKIASHVTAKPLTDPRKDGGLAKECTMRQICVHVGARVCLYCNCMCMCMRVCIFVCARACACVCVERGVGWHTHLALVSNACTHVNVVKPAAAKQVISGNAPQTICNARARCVYVCARVFTCLYVCVCACAHRVFVYVFAWRCTHPPPCT